jgi:hypothetical protein
VAAMNGGGTRRWGWGSGRAESQRADAQAAKDTAAAAFYELDTAQRDLRISIETLSAVDDSRPAQKAVRDFADFGARIDQVSQEYIAVVDAHDLDRDDLDSATAARAQAELKKTTQDLERVKKELERFGESLGPLLSQAETQLARLAPSVERARQGLLAASNALDSARSSGLKADDLAGRLAALSPELTKLNEGAGQHGVKDTLHRADRVVREAEAIRGEAERLPERAAAYAGGPSRACAQRVAAPLQRGVLAGPPAGAGSGRAVGAAGRGEAGGGPQGAGRAAMGRCHLAVVDRTGPVEQCR